MSLETLLEAARYLEYRTAAKARGEPHDYNTYAKLTNGGLPCASYAEEEEAGEAESPPSSNGDEGGKERRRTLGAGTREVHNKLEKNRRAHLKECFDCLKKQIPGMDDKKTSNLSILRSALRYIQTLKRKEREHEHELERLAREKISYQQRLVALKKEMSIQLDSTDIPTMHLDSDVDNETNSTSTASECGPLSDVEDEKFDVQSPAMVTLPSSVVTAQPPIISAPPPKSIINVPLPAPSLGKLAVTRFPATSTTVSAPQTVASTSLASSNAAASSKPVPVPIATSAPATAIASNKTSPLTVSATVQLPTQIVPQQAGIHVNNGAGVIAHPAVQVIAAQPGVRVISAGSASLPAIHSSATTSTTFSNGVNMLAQKVVAVSSSNKPITVPAVTLSKSKMVPVPVVHNAQAISAGKTLTATVPLTIPTNLTSLQRTMTLQTTPMPTQGLVSFTGIGAAISGATSLPARTLQVNNANVKPTTQILQQTLSQQRTVISPAVRAHAPQGNAMSAQMNNLPRQILSAVKPVTHVRAPLTQITHVMQSTPLASVGQLVPPGTHMSTMTPLVGGVSMMNHAMAQMITQPSLGKVTVAASPILKPVLSLIHI